MFTGIIEHLGIVKEILKDQSNIHFTIASELAKEAYIDQSISHNGVCLTVVSINESEYVVTAIQETLEVTTLKDWRIGTIVNLERSMLPSTRLDGHFVQGHVDMVTVCTQVEILEGSWYFTFVLPQEFNHLIVHKGSVAINGTSLTVITDHVRDGHFKVAIIPYTYEHTSFKVLKSGHNVNIEFDILGKYIAKHIGNYIPKI